MSKDFTFITEECEKMIFNLFLIKTFHMYNAGMKSGNQTPEPFGVGVSDGSS